MKKTSVITGKVLKVLGLVISLGALFKDAKRTHLD